jgi:hypothetical protein
VVGVATVPFRHNPPSNTPTPTTTLEFHESVSLRDEDHIRDQEQSDLQCFHKKSCGRNPRTGADKSLNRGFHGLHG